MQRLSYLDKIKAKSLTHFHWVLNPMCSLIILFRQGPHNNRGYSVLESREGHRTIPAILISHSLYQTALATENSIQPRQRVWNEEVVHRGVDRVNG